MFGTSKVQIYENAMELFTYSITTREHSFILNGTKNSQ